MSVAVPRFAGRVFAASSAAFLALSGCTAGAPSFVSSDIRLDAAGDDEDIDSEQTRSCVNRSGQVFVVWGDDRDGSDAIWFNRSLDGGETWLEDAVRLNHSQARASSPAIACNAEGVFVVWEDRRDGELDNANIYYNRSWDGGDTWLDDDVRLDDDPDGKTMSQMPQITVADQLYVTWADNPEGAFDIYAATTTDGSVFEPPVRLDSDEAGAAYSGKPRLTADGQGNVFVVWEDSRDGGQDIYFAASYDSAATWEPDQRIDVGDDPGASESFAPRLSTDGEHLYVVWHDERHGGRDILMNWSPNQGLTWTTEATRVDSDTAGIADSLFPDVSVNNGVAHVAWQDARSGGYDVYYRRGVDGDFAEPELRLDTDAPGAGNSLHPRVVTRGQSVVVAWEDYRADGGDGYNDLYYNFSVDEGLVWDTDLRIDSMDPGASYKVDLDVDLRGGEVYATWTDGRRGNSDVFFHRLVLGEQAQFIEVDAESAP